MESTGDWKVLDWIPDSLRVEDRIRLLQFDDQYIEFDCSGLQGDFPFGKVSGGWTVILYGIDARSVVVTPESARRVTWVIKEWIGGAISFGDKVETFEIEGVKDSGRVDVTLKSLKSVGTLSHGTYAVTATGAWTLHLADCSESEPVVLEGPTSPASVVGKKTTAVDFGHEVKGIAVTGGTWARFHKPANDVVCRDVTFLAFDDDLRGATEIDGAEELKAKSINAQGSIECNQVVVDNSILGSDGQIKVTGSLVEVLGGLRDCEITLRNPGAELRVGAQPGSGITRAGWSAVKKQFTNGSAEGGERGADHSGVVVDNTVIRGDGDIRIDGSTRDCEVNVNGQVGITGDFTFSSSGKGRQVLSATEIAVNGVVDLGRRSMKFKDLFSATELVDASQAKGGGVAVFGSLHRSCLEGGQVQVREDITDSTVQGNKVLEIGNVDKKSRIEAHGTAQFNGKVLGAVVWKLPATGRAGSALHIANSIERLEIEGPLNARAGKIPRLYTKSFPRYLEVAGTIELAWPPGSRKSKKKQLPATNSVLLKNGARLVVNVEINVGKVKLASTEATIEVGSSAASEPKIVQLTLAGLPGDTDETLKKGVLSLVGSNTRFQVVLAEEHAPRLKMAGQELHVIRGSVAVSVESRFPEGGSGRGKGGIRGSSSLDIEPTLSAEDGATIDDVTGRFRVGALGGRIVGHRSGPGNWMMWWKWFGNKEIRSGKSRPYQSAVVVGIDERPSDAPRRKGELIDVDVATLLTEDVSHLGRFQVFEPLDVGLVHEAKTHGKGRKSWKEPDCKSRAQRLRDIAEATRTRAVSGSSYSAAMWAAARSHAVSLGEGRSGERFLRFLHRIVGYGVRPIPAVATYVCTLLAGAGMLTWVDSQQPMDPEATCLQCKQGNYGFPDQLERVLVLPTSLFRGTGGGAIPYRPIGNSLGAQSLATLTMTVLLGFIVVALKNFLMRPRGDSPIG